MVWQAESGVGAAAEAVDAIAARAIPATSKTLAAARRETNVRTCGNSESFVPSTLNGTYNVTCGSGRFAKAGGSGNFTQNNFIVPTDAKGHPEFGATVSGGPAAIIRFDGLLTTKFPTAAPTPTVTSTPTITATRTVTPTATITVTPTVTNHADRDHHADRDGYSYRDSDCNAYVKPQDANPDRNQYADGDSDFDAPAISEVPGAPRHDR
jgi:hypothetical protein